MIKKILAVLVILSTITFVACKQKNEEVLAIVDEEPGLEKVVEAFGVVKSNNVKNIIIEFPAQVEEVFVKEGQKVNRGDRLFKVSLNDYKTQLEGKRILIELEKNKIDRLKADIIKKENLLNKNEDPEIKKLVFEYNSRNSEYKRLSEELKVKEKLYSSGSISQGDFETYKKGVEEERKAAESISLSLESYKFSKSREVDALGDQLLAAESNLKVLQHEEKIMASKLNNGILNGEYIVSDTDNAVVSEITCTNGDIVTIGFKLCKLIQSDDLYIEAKVPEEFIKDLKPLQQANLIPQADRTKEFNGEVVEISGKALQQNGETSIIVRLDIKDNDGFLMPEFNVDVELKK